MKIEIDKPIRVELNDKRHINSENYEIEPQNKNDGIPKTIFKSAPVIYEIVKDEYQNEINRTSVLDTKIGIMLPIVSTYFFLVIDKIDAVNYKDKLWEHLKSMPQGGMMAYDWLALISLLLSVVSVALLIIAVATHRYKMLDARWFNSLKYFGKDADELQAVLVTVYRTSISHNEYINDKRAAFYIWGIVVAAISIGFYIAYLILK